MHNRTIITLAACLLMILSGVAIADQKSSQLQTDDQTSGQRESRQQGSKADTEKEKGLRQFDPSEKIKADSAVDFPVDI
ncbi:MAG: hypothetical protein GY934_22875 [Gammaproteobacteria bacterium]|nr:hypothetical protein [Gammaproteobacteria bacterium]